MEFGGGIPSVAKRKATRGTGKRLKNVVKIESQDERVLYSNALSFYDVAPEVTLTLSEFEKFALARLKVLRIIERINLTSEIKYSVNWRLAIVAEMKTQKLDQFVELLRLTDTDTPATLGIPVTSVPSDTLLGVRKFDHISHFLLRLAFARTEEQRKWFISLEIDFFRLKLLTRGSHEATAFLKSHNFPGIEATYEEKKELAKEICHASNLSPNSLANPESFQVYKLNFVFAIDLVRQRKVYLRGGFAYVPFNELVSVICSSYRSYLSESISTVKKKMYLVEQDQRIMNVIEDFDKRHTGNDYNTKKGSDSAVTVQQLESYSHKSFPLCMKSLYDVVKKDHHLKHWGRLQLGLFFKAVGLPLDEATNFWRGHFTKRPEIDGSRFDKQYLYNIRHMYGQEGKRADYTPYSCMKIITSSVGPGDHHGCPFKHSDAAHLRTKLVDAEIPSQGIKEILDLVTNQHFQIACQKYFEYTHDNFSIEGGVNHPNQYFEESRDTLTGKKTIRAKEKADQAKKTTKIYSDGRSSQSQAVPQEQTPDDFDSDHMDVDEVNQLFAEINY